MEKSDTLKKFGSDFQQKCLSALLSDKSFIERISDIVEPHFFESDSYQWICQQGLSYFFEYKTLPTLTVFKVKIDAIENDILKSMIIDSLKLVYGKMDSNDLNFVKEQFLEFCKNQSLKKAVLDSVEFLNSGEYEKIKMAVDQALKAGVERNVGHIYDEDIEARMTMASRKCVKTNIPQIDELLDGGLGAGELGVIAGNPGGGKSWLLVKFGAEAMRQGKNVLHVTLELNENYVGLRYDSVFTKINFQDIRNNRETVESTLSNIDGKLVIKYYPIKSIAALTIKNHIERLSILGKKIDLLIVDYADILRSVSSETGTNSYNSAGSIYEELRGIAGELQIPTWTASQVSRSGAKEDIIEAQNMADSYKKVMIADVVISISRKTSDKTKGTARVHIMKNRFGADGMTFPSKFDTSCGHIELFDQDSQDGMELQNLMNDGEVEEENIVKKALNKKYQEMKNRKD